MSRVVIEIKDGYITKLMCSQNTDITIVDWDDIENGNPVEQYPEPARADAAIDDYLNGVDEKIDLMWKCSICEYAGTSEDFEEPGVCLACAKLSEEAEKDRQMALELPVDAEMLGYMGDM